MSRDDTWPDDSEDFSFEAVGGVYGHCPTGGPGRVFGIRATMTRWRPESEVVNLWLRDGGNGFSVSFDIPPEVLRQLADTATEWFATPPDAVTE